VGLTVALAWIKHKTPVSQLDHGPVIVGRHISATFPGQIAVVSGDIAIDRLGPSGLPGATPKGSVRTDGTS